MLAGETKNRGKATSDLTPRRAGGVGCKRLRLRLGNNLSRSGTWLSRKPHVQLCAFFILLEDPNGGNIPFNTRNIKTQQSFCTSFLSPSLV